MKKKNKTDLLCALRFNFFQLDINLYVKIEYLTK